MSFFGFFLDARDKRLAHDEAIASIEKHGKDAVRILELKTKKSSTGKRRAIYRRAASIAKAAMRDAGATPEL